MSSGGDISSKRKALLAKVFSITPKTIGNHLKEDRPYLKIMEMWDDFELETFLRTGEIRKPCKENKHDELLDKDFIVKTCLFKIDAKLESKLLRPILISALKDNHVKEALTIDSLVGAIIRVKGGIATHANHRTIVREFVEKYLSDFEVSYLVKHFSS